MCQKTEIIYFYEQSISRFITVNGTRAKDQDIRICLLQAVDGYSLTNLITLIQQDFRSRLADQ